MSDADEGLRVWGGTVRLQAELMMSDGRTLIGALHCLPLAPSHSGSETPGDVLNRPEAFLPLTLPGERVVFVGKDQLLIVTVHPEEQVEDPDRRSAARSVGLRIELVSGETFEGMLALELPPNRPRALDYLNQAPGFFPLRAGDAIRYINRRYVRLATPLT